MSIKEKISKLEIRKYLSFFEFYYYVLTKNPKKYELEPRADTLNYFVILSTPLVIWMISMIVFIASNGQMVARLIFSAIGVFLVVNPVICKHIFSQAMAIEDARREAEHAANKERIRREAEEQLKQAEENLRLFREQQERLRRENARRRKEQQERQAMDYVKRLYDLLGIVPTKDIEIIKKAYKQKAKKLHPDAEHGDESKFIELTDAYETILKIVS